MARKMATRATLTASAIEALRPRDDRYEVSDTGAKGLRLRVLPSGTKVFLWRVSSLKRVITIGPWSKEPAPGHVTLEQARVRLVELKGARKGGAEVLKGAAESARRRLAPLPSEAGQTVADLAAVFMRDRIRPHRKRPEVAQYLLDREVVPVIGDWTTGWIDTNLRAAKIGCRELVAKIIHKREAPVHAGKVLGILKQLFMFAEGRGDIERSPVAALKAKELGITAIESKRYLDELEVGRFWRALGDAVPVAQVKRKDYRTGKVRTFKQRLQPLAAQTRAALRLLLLTGARSGELLKARWANVDLDGATWTIPPEDQKLSPAEAAKADPFVIPLAPAAVELFKALKQEAGKSPWVMASDAECGHYEEKSLGHAMRKLCGGKSPRLELPGGEASPHDLRRTMRTWLGKLGVAPHVAERALNHSLGRIVKTYERHAYLEERRAAAEKWAAFVERCASGKAAPVVFLGERKPGVA